MPSDISTNEEPTPAPRSHLADWGIWRESVEKRLETLEADKGARDATWSDLAALDAAAVPFDHERWDESCRAEARARSVLKGSA